MSGPRYAGPVLAGALGVSTALLGLVVHRHTARIAETSLPWGVALSLLAAFALVAAAGAVSGAPAAACAAGGWVVCVLLALRGRTEGDYLLAADAVGGSFVWGGLATVALAFWVGLRLEPPPQR